MKIKILLVVFGLAAVSVEAQDAPEFKLQPISISIPHYLPGVMADSLAINTADSLYYTVKGQIFTPPVKTVAIKKKIKTNSPFNVFSELLAAYRKKDKKKIADLYNNSSKSTITDLLEGNEASAFLEYAGEVVRNNPRIVGCIEYKEGVLIYSRDDKYGLHENYIVNESGSYKLSSLNDSSARGWNIGLYFKYKPGMMIPVKNVLLPDSIHMENSMTVVIILPEPLRWVAIYFGNPGEPIKALVQDNGSNDLDKQKRVVRFRVPATIFPTTGTYNFYIASFNYPVQKISADFMVPEAMHVIKVY